MLAAGQANGQVSIFQIQKQLPEDLNLVAPFAKQKPIERYTIRDLHAARISCCEWSKNGMKLFSGDSEGVVVLTEIDYQMHLSKSVAILSESFEIVQLSWIKSHLLISTLYRSIICSLSSKSNVEEAANESQWKITQVGKKDRKQLAACGGVILSASSPLEQPRVLCARPGLRFWLADLQGNVQKTLLFKEAILHSPSWEIPLLNPLNYHKQPETDINTLNFGPILNYQDNNHIITHDEKTLYLLNLDKLKLEATAKGFRKILDFCVCKKEIFVLEGERSLLRLAADPEKPNKNARVIFNPSMPPPLPFMGASNHYLFEAPVEYEPEEVPVIKAEECFELPPIDNLNLSIPIELAVESPRTVQNKRLEIFQQISEMNFEENILHSSGKKHKRKLKENSKLKKPNGIVEIGHIVDDDGKKDSEQQQKHTPNSLELFNKATLMEASYCNEHKYVNLVHFNILTK